MNVATLHEAATIPYERIESDRQVHSKTRVGKVISHTAYAAFLVCSSFSCHLPKFEPTPKQALAIVASDMSSLSAVSSPEEKEAELIDAIENCIAHCTVPMLQPLITLVQKKDLQAQDVINVIALIEDANVRRSFLQIIQLIGDNPDYLDTALHHLKARANATVVSVSSFTNMFRKESTKKDGRPIMTIAQKEFIENMHPLICEFLKQGKPGIASLFKIVAESCKSENATKSSMAMQ
ncbi:MAG: hypothetical protein KBD00_02530 [Candidatus Peribacteraceae bacterium]|nr:hypothetical protein [Candidatus Peribacteraceae bacterium]